MSNVLNVDFENIHVQGHLWPKYTCFVWVIKAVLEYYGFRLSDFMLGKQWGFIYRRKNGTISVKLDSVQGDLKHFHGIKVVKKKFENAEECLSEIIAYLRAKNPVILPVCVYHLPYHHSFLGKLASEASQKVVNEIGALKRGEPRNQLIHHGNHIAVVTGENNNDLHITDLFIHNRAPYKGWISSENLLVAIDSLFLGEDRNSLYSIEFKDRNIGFNKGKIEEALHRNILAMLSFTTSNNGIFYGIDGMRALELDMNTWKDLEKNYLQKRELQLFDDMYYVVLQRDSHMSFLLDASAIIPYDFKFVLDLIEKNYQLYIKMRSLLYKGTLGDPFKVLNVIREMFKKARMNEEKAMGEIKNAFLMLQNS